MKVIIVEPTAVWQKGKVLVIASVIAGSSVLGIWALDAINTAMDYELSDWIFFPVFFGVGLLYPIIALVASYKRLPTLRLGAFFGLSFGLGWYVTLEVSQAIEYTIWKGFRPEERTLANLLSRQTQRLMIELGITLAVGLIVWGLCRLFRGKVIIQDGRTCVGCGYNLTGNESGICPECATPVPKREPTP